MNLPNSIDAADDNLSQEPEFESCLNISSGEYRLNQTKLLYESHMIQWAISKFNKTKKSFQIKIDETNATSSKLLSQSSLGAVLALINDEKIEGISRQDTEKFKAHFFETQNSWPDLSVSESAKLFCLDTRPGLTSGIPAGGLAQQLYQKNLSQNLVDADAFVPLVDQLTNAVVDSSSVKGKIIQKKEKLALIIYELFKNTHDHARHRVDGANLNSLRGIYSRYYSVASIKSQLNASSPNFVEQYVGIFLSELEKKNPSTAEESGFSGFLELSVFDSGPGIAAKWLGLDNPPADTSIQYKALVSCLAKGASTSGNNERGYGLWKVLEELKQLKGLIAVRTNNLHAATQFRTVRHQSKSSARLGGRQIPDEVLYDWCRRASNLQKGYPSVQGALISILVPIGEL